MSNIGYYLFLLAAIIVAVYLIKKVTSCIVKTIVGLVLVLLLACAYFMLS